VFEELFKSVRSPGKEMLDHIKAGDEKYLKLLYHKFRSKCVGWFQKRQNLTHEEAAEIYQKAFTIFYYNVKDGKVTELNSELSTYLIGVGKNLVKEMLRSRKRTLPLDEIPDKFVTDAEGIRTHEINHQKILIERILKKVGDPCRTLLLLYYFKNYSYEAIAINMGYKDKDGVKKKKSLCLRKIREQLAKH
jgi:RNA polymerase sigma factor (sigma-70 family)